MRLRQFRTQTPAGGVIEDYTDLSGLCQIALAAYAAGERSERLVDFVTWLTSVGGKPTVEQFEAWCRSHGMQLVPMSAENVEN